MKPKFKIGDIVYDELSIDRVIEVTADQYILEVVTVTDFSTGVGVGGKVKYPIDHGHKKYQIHKATIFNDQIAEIIRDDS